MKTGKIIQRVFLISTLMIIFLGCATIEKDNIINTSTQFNLAVEKAQNEMLLLNIVRASKRHPMYITTLTNIKGSVSYGLQTGSINIPFAKFGKGPSSNGLYSLAPNASYATNPLFDIAPLSTKEFVRGFLSPISPETVYDYWQQGWPREMVLYLFVRGIKYKDRYDRNCPTADSFQNFQATIKDIVAKECQLEKKDADEAIGPELKKKVLSADVKNLVEIQKAGLKLVPGEHDTYQLKAPKTDYFINCRTKTFQLWVDTKPPKDDSGRLRKSTTEPFEMYLRSPEEILYYLGEIMRYHEKKKQLALKDSEKCEDMDILFSARKATEEDTNPSVTVDYEGTKYVIPQSPLFEDKCPDDRSMHVLSLVSLLISKQQSAAEIPPPTGVVTTIGGK